jgi:hypothetical protein
VVRYRHAALVDVPGCVQKVMGSVASLLASLCVQSCPCRNA